MAMLRLPADDWTVAVAVVDRATEIMREARRQQARK